jgi:hypothetical protein
LIVGGAGGKGGANLGEGRRGTGAIKNGLLDGRGGMVCGRRPASVGVSSTKPTEPGIFFEEFPHHKLCLRASGRLLRTLREG